MFRTRIVVPAIVLGAQVFAGPAFSMTPEALWQDIRQEISSAGFVVTASEEHRGGDLVITGLRLKQQAPDHQETTAETGDIVLHPQPNGSVEIRIKAPWPVTVTRSGGPQSLTTRAQYDAGDLRILATEDGPDIRFTFSGSKAAFALSTLTGSAQHPLATGKLTTTGISGEARMSPAHRFSKTVDLADAELTARITPHVPPQGQTAQVGGATIEAHGEQLKISSSGSFGAILAGTATADDEAKSNLSWQSGRIRAVIEEAGDPVTLTLASGVGHSNGHVSGGRIASTGTARNLSLSLATKAMQQPLQLQITGMSSDLQGPVSPGDAPQPFSSALDLTGITLSDESWDTLDPGRHLNRTPGSLSLRLSGTGEVKDSARPMLPGQPDLPFSPDMLSVDRLDLKLLGAEISANGRVDVHQPSGATHPGPRFTGHADLSAHGLMAAFKSLSDAGLLSPAQALMLPAMTGMFAQTTGPDDLKSHVLLGPDGLTVNGTKLGR